MKIKAAVVNQSATNLLCHKSILALRGVNVRRERRTKTIFEASAESAAIERNEPQSKIIEREIWRPPPALINP